MSTRKTKSAKIPLQGPCVEQISVSSISPGPYQTRTSFSDIPELAKNIEAIGLLQPIGVFKQEDNSLYALAWGERRLRAFMHLGHETIPAYVVSRESAQQAAVAENLHRVALSPLEEAESVKILLQSFSAAEAAQCLGVTPRWVASRARICNLSAEWKKEISNPDSDFHALPVSFLEIVAKYQHDKQNELLEWDCNTCSTDMIKKHCEQHFEHRLDSAPWDLTTDRLADCFPCSSCEFRTSFDPDLFEPILNKNKKEIDRCLRPDCFALKMQAYLSAKAAELKAQNKNAIVTHSYSPAVSHESELYKSAIPEHAFTPCKKSDEGAVPALSLDTANAGKVSYVKIDQTALALHNQNDPTKKPAKTQDDKEAALHKRRLKLITSILLDYLRNSVTPPVALSDFSIVCLAIGVGADPFSDRRSLDFCEALDFSSAHLLCPEAEAYKLLSQNVISAICDVLSNRISQKIFNEELLRKICSLLHLDFETYLSDATANIPRPKAWDKVKVTKS